MMERLLPEYSVLMSVYFKDNPEWLRVALESMAEQTLVPKEIVLVADGPISAELMHVVDDFSSAHPNLLIFVPLVNNIGLGPALNAGFSYCSGEVIVRMDSDDISVPERCEKQMEIIAAGFDMVGCNVAEFSKDPTITNAVRVMPPSNEDILRFAHSRAPFVHPTFCVKRTAFEDVGGYQSVPYAEDFDFFIRLLIAGNRGCNIQQNLVYVRVDENAYRRRGGVSYARDMVSFNVAEYRRGWFTARDLLVRSFANIVVSLVPNRLRDVIYKRLLRR